MSKYYDGTKLLSLSDIDGKQPEIYMVTTNRTGGKTTYFNRMVVNRFLKSGAKFALLYRFGYELDDVADKFFKDIQSLFFEDYILKAEKRAKGVYSELFLYDRRYGEDKGKPCGYAIPLNKADAIKKISHLFSDVDSMVFDEFQSETNTYCDKEVSKFQSIHVSIARGQGQQYRRVPVYMIANPISIINPYYVKLNISSRLKKDTKFLKGHGWVLEQGFNESASLAQSESAFNRAFADDDYAVYSQQGVYLNDNDAFIEKPKGNGKYLATIRYNGSEFGIRQYAGEGVIYCDDKPDTSYPHKLAVTTEDHNINYVMLKANKIFVDLMRFYFDKGCFRFKDLRSKEAVMKMISY